MPSYFIAFIVTLYASIPAAADSEKSGSKVWYTYPNSRKDRYISEETYLPAYHFPQAGDKVRWEVYPGIDGKEQPNYKITTYDMEVRGNRLHARKDTLSQAEEVWIENISTFQHVLFYRVTLIDNVTKRDEYDRPVFKKGADFFWVSGHNIRRKK